MIKLKPKIVKSDFINRSRLHAVHCYSQAWMDVMKIEVFMEGVKYAIEQLKKNKS